MTCCVIRSSNRNRCWFLIQWRLATPLCSGANYPKRRHRAADGLPLDVADRHYTQMKSESFEKIMRLPLTSAAGETEVNILDHLGCGPTLLFHNDTCLCVGIGQHKTKSLVLERPIICGWSGNSSTIPETLQKWHRVISVKQCQRIECWHANVVPLAWQYPAFRLDALQFVLITSPSTHLLRLSLFTSLFKTIHQTTPLSTGICHILPFHWQFLLFWAVQIAYWKDHQHIGTHLKTTLRLFPLTLLRRAFGELSRRREPPLQRRVQWNHVHWMSPQVGRICFVRQTRLKLHLCVCMTFWWRSADVSSRNLFLW